MTNYGMVIFKDVMISMRDGTRLATDIYRPAVNGNLVDEPLPTLFVRTSYDKTGPWLTDEVVHHFPQNGYVLVLQDLRGRHRSEGMGEYWHVVNEDAGIDGYDTIEWIAQQAWSNGRVGMMGSSHLALTQTHAALYRPPHLTAIWPDVMPTNSYMHQVRWGGAMQLHMFGALFLHAYDSQEIRDDPAAYQRILAAMGDLRKWVHRTPFERGNNPLADVPNLEQILFDYYTRGSYDEFWAKEPNNYEPHWDRHADIPGTYSSGWYDPYVIAATNYYAEMSRRLSQPQRLVIGPWTHGGMRGGKTYALDVDFGPESAWGTEIYNAERLRWFDTFLKDEPTGVVDEAPVRLFIMGGGSGRKTDLGKLDHGGSWRSEFEWPLARTSFTNYYLHPNQRLAPTAPPPTDLSLMYEYDPDNPVPSIAGSVTGFFELLPVGELDTTIGADYIRVRSRMRSLVPDGAADQKITQATQRLLAQPTDTVRLSERADVLVFETAPLTQDVEVTGPIAVHLWISSSAPDTDFTAKLLDVYPPNEDYPDGYDMNLSDGILRTRYRHSFTQESMLSPEEIEPITITLPPTSNLFKAGHRIRLDISSSNFPRFDLNPNTGEAMGRHTHMQIAKNSIYLGPAYPSHITLPIIPIK